MTTPRLKEDELYWILTGVYLAGFRAGDLKQQISVNPINEALLLITALYEKGKKK